MIYAIDNRPFPLQCVSQNPAQIGRRRGVTVPGLTRAHQALRDRPCGLSLICGPPHTQPERRTHVWQKTLTPGPSVIAACHLASIAIKTQKNSDPPSRRIKLLPDRWPGLSHNFLSFYADPAASAVSYYYFLNNLHRSFFNRRFPPDPNELNLFTHDWRIHYF
jgi:hypothetical protein